MIKLFRLFTTTTTKTEAFLIFSIIYFIILTFTMFEKKNVILCLIGKQFIFSRKNYVNGNNFSFIISTLILFAK